MPSPAPDRDDASPRSTISTGLVAVAFLVFVLFYILSPIPILVAVDKMGATEAVEPVFSVVYWPLVWAYDHIPAVQAFYDAYSNLFGYP